MPYYHCRKCQHEFEFIPSKGDPPKCDWCGTDKPVMLEEETPLEKMKIQYTIEISYKTGDSFGSEDRVSTLEHLWSNLDKVTESLNRIKNHYEYCEQNYDIWSKPTKKLPVGVGWNERHRMIMLILVDDNGKEFNYSSFWTGYFEMLYEAKIVTFENPLHSYRP